VTIEAILFDIGGVLELTPPTGWQERWGATLGLSTDELLARLEPAAGGGDTGAMTLPQVERAIAAALGLDGAALERLMDDLWSEYLGTLNEELADYFAALRPRYRTGILSNSFVGARERERERYSFEEMCDVIVYSHEEGLLKPDPRAFLLACERLNTSPARCVLLDDAEENVEGARAIGMHAVAFADNAQAIRDLEQLLDRGPG
jgi:epoxide hydrolase-like predicted phosphatase